ncbi:MAG: anaerobic ribonucleoside-triphosphate reductase activating protein [Lachnospiraceae bacterium]|nr:anaerobic ribonucleoside-triphosphate reductase activating protein [Lachnospiraceae bacterium]
MISGLQKMTLLDFPGKVACTVFLRGCNLRCPYCHNSHLFSDKAETIMENKDFFRFLESRKGLLDGVCVSGGEPTLYENLPSFLKEIKALGFMVKLDTNGTKPEMVKMLIENELVDYIAIDIKSCPDRYGEATGKDNFDISQTEETIKLLMEGKVQYEFRTTVVEQLHDAECMLNMGKWLSSLVPGKKPSHLFLQSFIDRDTVLFSGLSSPDESDMEKFAEILSPFFDKVTIRNR